jgi:replication factor A1
MELIDVYGSQIEAVCFGASADHWDSQISQGKVYLISNGTVKLANKKFSNVKCDYNIILEKESEVTEVSGVDTNIPDQAFDFVQISQLESGPEGNVRSTIDIIGVVLDVSEQESINLKNGISKVRKHITLADNSMCSIQLTIWGDKMNEEINPSVGQILSIKGARVSDYSGKSLNVSDDHAKVFVDMDSPEVQQLEN